MVGNLHINYQGSLSSIGTEPTNGKKHDVGEFLQKPAVKAAPMSSEKEPVFPESRLAIFVFLSSKFLGVPDIVANEGSALLFHIFPSTYAGVRDSWYEAEKGATLISRC